MRASLCWFLSHLRHVPWLFRSRSGNDPTVNINVSQYDNTRSAITGATYKSSALRISVISAVPLDQIARFATKSLFEREATLIMNSVDRDIVAITGEERAARRLVTQWCGFPPGEPPAGAPDREIYAQLSAQYANKLAEHFSALSTEAIVACFVTLDEEALKINRQVIAMLQLMKHQSAPVRLGGYTPRYVTPAPVAAPAADEPDEIIVLI